jgi:gliding motility-associated-like protein
MKHFLVFIVFLFFYFGVFSQNLVPNGDFEYYTQLPVLEGSIKFAYPWFSPHKSCKSEYLNKGSLDPFLSVPNNANGSHQNSHSGSGYVWIASYNDLWVYRECIEVKLKEPLKPNTCYTCSFWISLIDICMFRCNNIQVYFSSDSVTNNSNNCDNMPFLPQLSYSGGSWIDSVNWWHFNESFVATGGESFMTIGNFLNDAQTSVQLYNPLGWSHDAAFYVDDVAVYPCDAPLVTAQAGEDTEICPGDNISLSTTRYDYYKYKWFEADGTLIDTTSSISVSPSSATTYKLWIKDFLNQESYDTVTVRIKDCSPEPSAEIPNIITPNSDGHNDLFYVKGNKIEKLNLLIYNRWGSKVFEGNTPQATWDGKFNGKNCEAGVYYYVADITFTNGKKETKQGTVTLVR